MSPELVIVVVVALAVAMASASTFVSKRRRVFQNVEVAWKDYAQKRGMRFIFVGGWTRATVVSGFPPAIEGEVQGVPVDVTIDYTRGAPMTRVEATLPSVSSDFLFAIYRRRTVDRIRAELRGVEEAVTGNKVFDAAFALFSNDVDLARSILDRRLAQVIRDFPRDFSYLYASRTHFTLMWPGVETDQAALDAAIQVVFTACRRRA